MEGVLLGAVALVARLLIDLSTQQLQAYDAAGRLLYSAPVSSGLPATPTPTGEFQVGSKYAETSLTGRDYRIAQVRDVMCLSGGGLRPDAVCLHPAPWQERAGEPFGVPRSHGCLRLSSASARWLFAHTPLATPVTIRR
jgi:lipoprotein-anchoring transpeptidase ErfK/SrfK